MCCGDKIHGYQIGQIFFAFLAGITNLGTMQMSFQTPNWVVWKKNATDDGELRFGLWATLACDHTGCIEANKIVETKFVEDMDLTWRIAPAVLMYVSSTCLFIAWIWSMSTFCCRCCKFYMALPVFTGLSLGIWIGGVTSFGLQAVDRLIDPCNFSTDPDKPCYGKFGWGFIYACCIVGVLVVLVGLAVFVEMGAKKAKKSDKVSNVVPFVGGQVFVNDGKYVGAAWGGGNPFDPKLESKSWGQVGLQFA